MSRDTFTPTPRERLAGLIIGVTFPIFAGCTTTADVPDAEGTTTAVADPARVSTCAHILTDWSETLVMALEEGTTTPEPADVGAHTPEANIAADLQWPVRTYQMHRHTNPELAASYQRSADALIVDRCHAAHT